LDSAKEKGQNNVILPFIRKIRPFVAIEWNSYCEYAEKQYLCIRVDQRVVLKLSQLIGY